MPRSVRAPVSGAAGLPLGPLLQWQATRAARLRRACARILPRGAKGAREGLGRCNSIPEDSYDTHARWHSTLDAHLASAHCHPPRPASHQAAWTRTGRLAGIGCESVLLELLPAAHAALHGAFLGCRKAADRIQECLDTDCALLVLYMMMLERACGAVPAVLALRPLFAPPLRGRRSAACMAHAACAVCRPGSKDSLRGSDARRLSACGQHGRFCSLGSMWAGRRRRASASAKAAAGDTSEPRLGGHGAPWCKQLRTSAGAWNERVLATRAHAIRHLIEEQCLGRVQRRGAHRAATRSPRTRHRGAKAGGQVADPYQASKRVITCQNHPEGCTLALSSLSARKWLGHSTACRPRPH